MAHETRIVLVGGGRGGTLLLKSLARLDSAKVVGVCDPSPAAPALALAKSLGIATFTSVEATLAHVGFDVLIEATGVEAVRRSLEGRLPPGTGFIDSRVARLFLHLTAALDDLQSKDAAAAAQRSQAQALATMARQVNETVQRFATSFSDLAQGSRQIAERQRDLGEAAAGVLLAVRESGKIVDAISRLAQETRILGLNAAIEAARAEEKGRGFAVVAGNVRQLAASSATAAERVHDALGDISSALSRVLKGLEGTAKAVQGQAHATETAAGWNQELSQSAHELSALAARLLALR